MAVGSQVARALGVSPRTVASLADVMRVELDSRAAELAEELHAGPAAKAKRGGEESAAPRVSIFKFDQSKAPALSDDPIAPDSPGGLAPTGRRPWAAGAPGGRHTCSAPAVPPAVQLGTLHAAVAFAACAPPTACALLPRLLAPPQSWRAAWAAACCPA